MTYKVGSLPPFNNSPIFHPLLACEDYGKIECPNTKKCIYPYYICDADDDCGDGWDEMNCCKSYFCYNYILGL